MFLRQKLQNKKLASRQQQSAASRMIFFRILLFSFWAMLCTALFFCVVLFANSFIADRFSVIANRFFSAKNNYAADRPIAPGQPMVLGAVTQKQNYNAGYGEVGPMQLSEAPQLVSTTPQLTLPSNIAAKSVLVYDLTNYQILFARNPSMRLPVASLTKLMTAIVATASPDFSKSITVTKNDQLDISPVLRLKEGDVVKPSDLVKAMLVGSANDAAMALANHFGGYENFINTMNQTAQKLGMTQTHYSTPVGFDMSGNYSTANDLRILVSAAMNVLPYQEIWRSTNFAFSSESGVKYYIRNSNNLVRHFPNIKSIKTGASPLALGNMIVLAGQPDKLLSEKPVSIDTPAEHSLISIVLNSPQREKETLELISAAIGK